MRFWAHSDRQGRSAKEPGNDWQLLAEHLDQVSRLARKIACDTAPEDSALQQMAASAGMLHDLGKYTDCFQKMLDGIGKDVPFHLRRARLV